MTLQDFTIYVESKFNSLFGDNVPQSTEELDLTDKYLLMTGITSLRENKIEDLLAAIQDKDAKESMLDQLAWGIPGGSVFKNLDANKDGKITIDDDTNTDGVIDDKDFEEHDYSKDYYTITMLEDAEIEFDTSITNQTLLYSINDGDWEDSLDDISLNAGDKMRCKGTCGLYDSSGTGSGTGENRIRYRNMIHPQGKYNVSGNIASLIYEDDFDNKTDYNVIINNEEYHISFNMMYYYIASENTYLINAKNLILPATTICNQCYEWMFQYCTSLTTAPELPATTLPNMCYDSMFYGCTSLTTAPELPATTLDYKCYECMFAGCTSLTTAPELPATILADECYACMFAGCTSLTVAPELPATTLTEACYNSMFGSCTSLTVAPELPAITLVSRCYDSMFNGCTNLNYIKALFTTIPSNSYTDNWVDGVSSTGTFVKNSESTWNVTGEDGIPTGWTVETASA